ncbi:hypothetical protein EVAR_2441_1 [Eumeta japonica]|uniref:Uncharacterized protein n=1 Tax=Eumeta variegata TaxID=151549 RepID=A0A4C1SQV9_EUMVA|nr:hypothetical protein EVAR_2441_1 [Eumeta japonica]
MLWSTWPQQKNKPVRTVRYNTHKIRACSNSFRYCFRPVSESSGVPFLFPSLYSPFPPYVHTKAGNTLVTPLRLRVSMGADNQLVTVARSSFAPKCYK